MAANAPGTAKVHHYLVGGETVAFRATRREHRYLRRFYRQAGGQRAAVLLAVGQADGHGSQAIVDDGRRAVPVPYPGRNPVDALRLAARSRWLARLPEGQMIMHGVAARIGGTILLVAGRAHSGKTTLLLDALIAHGATALAYDYLIVDANQGTGRNVPCIMNVRFLTLASVAGAAALLADHELELDGAVLAERYYAPGALRVPPSFAMPAERTAVVLSRGFAVGAPARLARISPADAAAGLSDVIRAWGGWADIDRVARLLAIAGPSSRERSLRLAHRLATANGYAFWHHGCPGPLITIAGGEPAAPCRDRWDTGRKPSFSRPHPDGMSRDPVTSRTAT
jgi:hypothetical protein